MGSDDARFDKCMAVPLKAMGGPCLPAYTTGAVNAMHGQDTAAEKGKMMAGRSMVGGPSTCTIGSWSSFVDTSIRRGPSPFSRSQPDDEREPQRIKVSRSEKGVRTIRVLSVVAERSGAMTDKTSLN
jgi:hypothetical protein